MKGGSAPRCLRRLKGDPTAELTGREPYRPAPMSTHRDPDPLGVYGEAMAGRGADTFDGPCAVASQKCHILQRPLKASPEPTAGRPVRPPSGCTARGEPYHGV